MQSLLEKLSPIFKSVFGQHTEISLNTKQEDVAEWDSVSHLELILELESEFELNLTPEEIENMKSVEAILRAIQSRQKIN
ncbi:MAG: phosphopantetheine-binding protein [Chloroherpetonaceae bacterium]|nr:phosphopantetheine-binding protein [Chloroherpetonaceae bacterium]MDW8465854.1 phosphopantetheine-binding protein [Chloroherpetonaceae bacterium]